MAVKLLERQTISYNCRGVKSKARMVHTGVAQGTIMHPTLFSFYLADMPRPTEPVKRICYADDITVWASGVKIPELEHKINGYLTEMSCFLRDNSLLISGSRSLTQSFPLFAIQNYQEYIWIHSYHLMLIAYKWPTESVKENNVLKALAGHKLETTKGNATVDHIKH